MKENILFGTGRNTKYEGSCAWNNSVAMHTAHSNANTNTKLTRNQQDALRFFLPFRHRLLQLRMFLWLKQKKNTGKRGRRRRRWITQRQILLHAGRVCIAIQLVLISMYFCLNLGFSLLKRIFNLNACDVCLFSRYLLYELMGIPCLNTTKLTNTLTYFAHIHIIYWLTYAICVWAQRELKLNASHFNYQALELCTYDIRTNTNAPNKRWWT